MGFWNRKSKDDPVKKIDSSGLKPVISESLCNAKKYLVHVSRCDKNALGGWDMCPEHVRMWETVFSDERV